MEDDGSEGSGGYCGRNEGSLGGGWWAGGMVLVGDVVLGRLSVRLGSGVVVGGCCWGVNMVDVVRGVGGCCGCAVSEGGGEVVIEVRDELMFWVLGV